jgi:hypothetical protein
MWGNRRIGFCRRTGVNDGGGTPALPGCGIFRFAKWWDSDFDCGMSTPASAYRPLETILGIALPVVAGLLVGLFVLATNQKSELPPRIFSNLRLISVQS